MQMVGPLSLFDADRGERVRERLRGKQLVEVVRSDVDRPVAEPSDGGVRDVPYMA